MPLIERTGTLAPVDDTVETPTIVSEQAIEDKYAASNWVGNTDDEVAAASDKIDQEYNLLGTSPTIDRVKTEVGTKEQQERRDTIQTISADKSVTSDQLAYNIRTVAEIDKQPVDLLESMAVDMAISDISVGWNSRIREEDRATYVRDRVDQLRVENYMAQRDVYDPSEDVGTVGAVIDFLGAIMPVNEAKSVYHAAKSIGLDPNLGDIAKMGDLKRAIIRKMKGLQGVEREIAAAKIDKSLAEHSGFFGHNSYIQKMLSQELTQTLDDKSWTLKVDSFVSFIDVLGVAKLGVNTISSVAKYAYGAASNSATAVRGLLRVQKGAPSNVMKTANPKVGEDIAAKIITDETGSVAKAHGTSRAATINDTILPNPVLEGAPIKVIEGMPAGVRAKVEKTRELLAGAVDRTIPDIRSIFAKTEITNAALKVTGQLETFFKTTANTATSNVVIKPNKIELEAIMQADEYGGWKSLQDVFDELNTKFKNPQTTDFKVMHREVDSDFYVDVTNQLDDIVKRSSAETMGDFVYGIKMDIPISPEWKHALGDDAVRAGAGSLGKFLSGPAQYNEWIRNLASVAVDRVGSFNKDISRTLEQGFKGLGKGFFKKNKEYDAVTDVLKQGAREEKWYSPHELKSHFSFTDSQMEAYYTFKEVSDAMYLATNADLYKTLAREGMVSLTFPSARGGKDIGLFGRGLPLEEAQSIARTSKNGVQLMAYNPMTGRTIALGDAAKVDKLYKQGKRVSVLRGTEKELGKYTPDGNNYFNYIIIDEAKGARVERLTQFPLKYREGHYHRVYKDDNFFVRRAKDGVSLNGATKAGFKIEETFGVAANRADAERIIRADMDKTGLPREAYPDPIKGKQWHEGRMQGQDDWDLIQASALSMTKARKQHLRGVEDLAELEDPITSLGRSISAIGNRIGKRDWYEANQAAWMKTYGKSLGARGYPETREVLKNAVDDAISSGTGKQRMGREALAYYDYIQMVRGTGSPISDKWKNWVFNSMSDSDSTLLQTLAPRAATLAEVANPVLKLKQSAYLFYLAWNPIKQLILQPSQIVNMLSVSPKYMSTGFVPELTALTAEAIGGKGGKLGKQLLKELDASGVTKNIDHHQWINQSESMKLLSGDALDNTSIRRLGTKLLKTPQKIGFEAGEKANQVMHWLVARNEYRLKNPDVNLLDKRHSDAILGRMRDLSGNMNVAGKFGYQGWGTVTGELLSGVFQFMSHSHKMLQMMVPAKVGGATFLTKAQKRRMAFTNTALAGAGLWPFVDDIVDMVQNDNPDLVMSPDLQKTFKRGLIDITLNKMLATASGEDVDINFHQTFNPTGAVEQFTHTIYDNVVNEPVRKWDFIAGIGASSTILDTISAVNTIWRAPEELLDTPEKVTKMVVSMAELSSGFSNYRKAQGIFNTGKIISKYGTVIDETNWLEGSAKVLGLTLDKEQTFYDALESLQGMRRVDQDLEDDMRLLVRNVERQLKDTDMTEIDKQIYLNTVVATYFDTIPERMRAYEAMKKFLYEDIGTGNQSIQSDLALKAYESGQHDYVLQQYRNHPDSSGAHIEYYNSLFQRGVQE